MSTAPTADRLASQLLSGRRPKDPVAVAERLLAVQAQDLRGARLAIRARTHRLTVTDVDRALTEDRSLVITWLNRGTLHLVRREDYGWLHVLTTPQLETGNARRLRQEGVSPGDAERGVDVIERALTTDGPLTRRQLRDRIAAADVPTKGQALVHLLLLASLRGISLRGPMVGNEQAHVLARDWVGQPASVDRDTALAELARRFLAGHGPADDRDLARWAGVPLRDARAGLAAIASELHERPDGLVTVGRRATHPAMPPPRLLGPYDPLLLGWVSREPIVGRHLSIVTDNGLFRPFALVDGRAVATWRLTNGEVRLEPFTRLKRADTVALEADAVDVVRFLAGTPSGA
jgi:winged helix DNA-binding protein